MANSTRLSRVEQAQLQTLISHSFSYSNIVRILKWYVAITARFIIRKK